MSDEELAALAEGRLPPDDAARLQVHLAGCRNCLAAYNDAVRYRMAWLARPEVFGSPTHLHEEGMAVAGTGGVARPNKPRLRNRLMILSALAGAVLIFLLFAVKPAWHNSRHAAGSHAAGATVSEPIRTLVGVTSANGMVLVDRGRSAEARRVMEPLVHDAPGRPLGVRAARLMARL